MKLRATRAAACLLALVGAGLCGGGRAAAGEARPKVTIDAHTRWVTALSFSPDGKMLATGERCRGLGLWTADGKRRLAKLKIKLTSVRCLAFHPKRPILAAGGGSGRVELFNLRTGRSLGVVYRHHELVRCVTFSPDGKLLFSGSYDGTGRLRNLQTTKTITMFDERNGRFESVAFSPDGKLIATGNAWRVEKGLSGVMELWDASTGKHVKTLAEKGTHGRTVTFSPDGKHLVYGCSNDTVVVWKLPVTGSKPEPERVLTGHQEDVHFVVVSGDSKRVMAADHSGRAIVWEVETGKELARLETLSIMALKLVTEKNEKVEWRNKVVYSAAFSPDGRTFATGSGDGIVRLFDLPKEFAIKTAR